MRYEDIIETLQQVVLEFCSALREAGVLSTEHEEFMASISEELARRASNIEQGIEELDLVILSLPNAVIGDLLPSLWWDYEFGYGSFFEGLSDLFKRTEWKFRWSYEPEELTLTYAIDRQLWVINNLQVDAEVEQFAYAEIYGNICDYLRRYGMTLCDIATGDQTGKLVLLPIAAVPLLAKQLITVEDARAEWLYTGIPKAKT